MLTKDKFLTVKELKYLLSMCNRFPGRDSILIRFLLYTGCRGCEALNVKKCDIAEGAVTIYGVKGSNDRTLPLPTEYFKELTFYSYGLEDQDILFPISIRTLRYIWNQWRTNDKKGVHALRHSFGIELYSKSKDIHLTQTALGHKSISNTLLYLRFVESQEKMKSFMNDMWQ